MNTAKRLEEAAARRDRRRSGDTGARRVGGDARAACPMSPPRGSATPSRLAGRSPSTSTRRASRVASTARSSTASRSSQRLRDVVERAETESRAWSRPSSARRASGSRGSSTSCWTASPAARPSSRQVRRIRRTTYWPLVEILRNAAGPRPSPSLPARTRAAVRAARAVASAATSRRRDLLGRPTVRRAERAQSAACSSSRTPLGGADLPRPGRLSRRLRRGTGLPDRLGRPSSSTRRPPRETSSALGGRREALLAGVGPRAARARSWRSPRATPSSSSSSPRSPPTRRRARCPFHRRSTPCSPRGSTSSRRAALAPRMRLRDRAPIRAARARGAGAARRRPAGDLLARRPHARRSRAAGSGTCRARIGTASRTASFGTPPTPDPQGAAGRPARGARTQAPGRRRARARRQTTSRATTSSRPAARCASSGAGAERARGARRGGSGAARACGSPGGRPRRSPGGDRPARARRRAPRRRKLQAWRGAPGAGSRPLGDRRARAKPGDARPCDRRCRARRRRQGGVARARRPRRVSPRPRHRRRVARGGGTGDRDLHRSSATTPRWRSPGAGWPSSSDARAATRGIRRALVTRRRLRAGRERRLRGVAGHRQPLHRAPLRADAGGGGSRTMPCAPR